MNEHQTKKTTIRIVLFSIAMLCLGMRSLYSQQCLNPTNPDLTGPSNQTFCDIEGRTVSELEAFSTSSSAEIVWYSLLGGSYNKIDSNTRLTTGTYYGDDRSNGLCSPNQLQVTVFVNGGPPILDPSIEFCSSENPTINSLVYTAEGAVTWYNEQFGGVAYNLEDPLVHDTVYWAEQEHGGCISARSSISVTFIDSNPITVPASQEFCSSNIPTIANLSGTTTESGATLNWYLSDTGGLPIAPTSQLTNGATYWGVQRLLNGCESEVRRSTTISIEDLPDPGTNGTYEACGIGATDENLFNFLGGTPQTGGTWTGPSSYSSSSHWGTFNSSTVTEGIYTYTISTGVCEDKSATVEVIINETPAPTGDSIQVFCEVDSPTIADLSALQTTSGGIITWYDTSSSNTPLNPIDFINNGAYYATQTVTSNGETCESISRLPVTVIINKPTSPTIANSTQYFCETANPKISDLVVSGTDIKWYETSTSLNPLDPNTVSLVDGEDYYATQTMTNSGKTCENAQRSQVNVSLIRSPIPTGNENQSFCVLEDSTVANLVAVGEDIKWYELGSNSVLPLGTALINNKKYYATQTVTSNGEICESILRLEVLVTLYNLVAPTPESSAFTQYFCAGENPTLQDFKMEESNLRWYNAPTDGDEYTTTIPLETEQLYWVAQVDENGCESSNRTEIKAVIHNPSAPTGAINQNFCAIDNPKVEDLEALGDAISWYADSDLTTPLAIGSDLLEGTYYATQTQFFLASNLSCEGKNQLEVNVTISQPQEPTTDSSSQYFCEIEKPTIGDLQVVGDDIQWYESRTATDRLSTTTPLIEGEDYWASQIVTNNGIACESISRLKVTVQLVIAPAPLGNEEQLFCAINNPEVSDIVVSGDNVQWYSTETSTVPLNESTPLSSGTYYATQILSGSVIFCESLDRLKVEVTVADPEPPQPVGGAFTQYFCEEDNPSLRDFSMVDTTLKWYDAATGGSEYKNLGTLLEDGKSYWVSKVDENGCEGISRTLIVSRIPSIPPPTTTSEPKEFCEIENATLANIPIIGEDIKWYYTSLGGNPLDKDELLETRTYYATQTIHDYDIYGNITCESKERLVINVTVYKVLTPVGDATQYFCETEDATVGDLQVAGDGVQWFDSPTSTLALPLSEPLSDKTNYFATQTDAITGCESKVRLKVFVELLNTDSPLTLNSFQDFCAIDIPIIDEIEIQGDDIRWYETIDSDIPLPSGTVLIDGEDYFATQIVLSNGIYCESAIRTKVEVTITNPPVPTAAETNINFCEIESQMLSQLNSYINESAIKWYDSPTGGNEYTDLSMLLTTGTYYASQLDNQDCEGMERLAISVTIYSTPPPVFSNSSPVFCEIDFPTIGELDNFATIGENIKWYNKDGQLLNSNDLLFSGDFYATQTDATSNCESLLKTRLTVQVVKTPAPTTTLTTQSFCEIDTPTINDFYVGGTFLKWYATQNSTVEIDPTALLIHGEDYWVSQTLQGCESLNRIAVIAQIEITPPPTSLYATQEFCVLERASINSINIEGTAIQWYSDENSNSPLEASHLLENGKSYWASQTEETISCESKQRFEVLIQFLDSPSPIVDTTQYFCQIDTPSVADLDASQNTNPILWYDTETSYWPLASDLLLIDGEDYWAAQVDPFTTCVSSVRIQVTAVITTDESPGIVDGGNQFCSIDNPTLTDLDDNVYPVKEGQVVWYDSEDLVNQLGLNIPLEEGGVYYATEVGGGCESRGPLRVEVTLNTCEEYDVVFYDGFSPTGDGVNDTFKTGNIKILYPDYRIEIFNRWGTILYEGNAQEPDWNGRINNNGEQLPPGVYYYIIYFNKDDRKPEQRKLYLSR